jgi:hypothetical protein
MRMKRLKYIPKCVSAIFLLTTLFILICCGGGGGGGRAKLILSINPAGLPSGQVNVPYNQSITMTAKGGKAPYTYVCESSGISGITVSTSLAGPTGDSVACTVSGTPTASGTYSRSLVNRCVKGI